MSNSFSDLHLDAALLRGVADLGFTEPTPIQRAAVPPALDGRDVLGSAMTGSGKTAAFVLPILQRLSRGSRGATRALVLTPTRELASQVEDHLRSLGRHTGLRSATVFGGVGHRPQERALRAGVDVVVATPGRLLDHLRQGVARFDRLEVLVLDEADRMLDMGFLPDVRRILSALPRRRQTMLFSATLPPSIVALSRELLTDPVRLDAERPSEPAVGITQEVLPVSQKLKSHLLLELLRRGDVDTALVFTRTKHRANRLQAFLARAGIACDRIHGNRSQKQREKALSAFKGGRLKVLVATDVASRGIDVVELPHVVNFDVPGQADDYVHRVGRTARAGSTGHAITFATPEDGRELAAIERMVGERLARRRLSGFDYEAGDVPRLEVPAAERIAAHRARQGAQRARGRAGAGRRGPGKDRGAGSRRGQSSAAGTRPATARSRSDGAPRKRPSRPGRDRF